MPHSIGPEVTAVPIIIVSSFGYFYRQKKINKLEENLQRATKKQWDLYEEDRDRRVTKKKWYKKSEIQKSIEKVIVGCCGIQVIWMILEGVY